MWARLKQVFENQLGGMPKAFWLLWGGTLVNRAGAFVVPFLTLYLTEARQLPVKEAGFIVGLFGAGSLISATVGGALADRIGRKSTMILGLCLGAVGMVSLGEATSPVAIAFATFGLGTVSEMYRPAMSAMVADVVPPDQRLRAFGLMYWASNLGFSIAPVVAGIVAQRSYRWLFFADAATTLVFALLIALRIPESLPEVKKEQPQRWGEMLEPLRDKTFARFLFLSFGVAMIINQFTVALPLQMRAQGISPAVYGKVIALNGLLIICIQPFMTSWVKSKSRAHVLALATLLTGLGMGLNGWATLPLEYALAITVWTAGEIIMSPVSSEVVADLSPIHMRGRYQGMFNMSWALSFFLAPFLSSVVLADFGATSLWIACAVAGAFLAWQYLRMGASLRPGEKKPRGADRDNPTCLSPS